MTLDTVDGETPLFLATSFIVTILIPPIPYAYLIFLDSLESSVRKTSANTSQCRMPFGSLSFKHVMIIQFAYTLPCIFKHSSSISMYLPKVYHTSIPSLRLMSARKSNSVATVETQGRSGWQSKSLQPQTV